MNIRLVADILQVEQELARIERMLKRQQEWRNARKISDVRATLAKALTHEQATLSAIFSRYQQTVA